MKNQINHLRVEKLNLKNRLVLIAPWAKIHSNRESNRQVEEVCISSLMKLSGKKPSHAKWSFTATYITFYFPWQQSNGSMLALFLFFLFVYLHFANYTYLHLILFSLEWKITPLICNLLCLENIQKKLPLLHKFHVSDAGV